MKAAAFALTKGRSSTFRQVHASDYDPVLSSPWKQRTPSCKTTERGQTTSSLARTSHESTGEALESEDTKAARPPHGRSGHSIRTSANRDLLLDVLSATATRREARAYISRFHSHRDAKRSSGSRQAGDDGHATAISYGVNLGHLYSSTRAVENSPSFGHAIPPKAYLDSTADPLPTALVQIKHPHTLDHVTLEGIGYTLSQLSRLGLNCVVVVSSCGSNQDASPPLDWRAAACAEADRVVAAIEVRGDQEARRLDSVLEASSYQAPAMSSVKLGGATRISDSEMLLAPLHRGTIPVVVCVGYDQSQRRVGFDASEVMLALTRELAGLATSSHAMGTKHAATRPPTSLDRIIILDPHGGIPSTKRHYDPHVFINLEQEYASIRDGLMSQATDNASRPENSGRDAMAVSDGYASHLANLQLLRDALALLPPSSSALITTPQQAATSALRPLYASSAPGVGTRSSRNPLIHNLLTDKPAFSSSLPRTRLGASSAALTSPAALPTTFVKRGMPVTIIPDPRLGPWEAPSADTPRLLFSDPRIDLPRLIHLIEDSFSRKLDAQHYLQRISSNLAGVIIAGAYEGGAILTWESGPEDAARETKAASPTPYLDKFAVLKRSQGAGGVADIVFSAMVQDCFPHGVCWRSRRDNPVNKWYFERSRGTWKIPVQPGTQGWTMFWTTDDIDGETFRSYESVCRTVATSWADGKTILD